jgi:hypothetical protein
VIYISHVSVRRIDKNHVSLLETKACNQARLSLSWLPWHQSVSTPHIDSPPQRYWYFWNYPVNFEDSGLILKLKSQTFTKVPFWIRTSCPLDGGELQNNWHEIEARAREARLLAQAGQWGKIKWPQVAGIGGLPVDWFWSTITLCLAIVSTVAWIRVNALVGCLVLNHSSKGVLLSGYVWTRQYTYRYLTPTEGE